MLRPQQQELKDLIDNIKNNKSKVNEIFLTWACGGGKSLAPVIISDLLIDKNDKQVVVVPRTSLQIQGEQTYESPYYKTNKIARIASNTGDPFRGCDTCFTTFQAIGCNPKKWIAVFEKYNCQLILDEAHHLSHHGEWIKAIQHLKDLSSLFVFMSGTIYRGDNSRIPFVPYDNDHNIIYDNTKNRQWIFYTEEQAIKDGNVLTYQTVLIDGSGKYIDNQQFERSFTKLGDNADHLRCVFKTEYALTLLKMTVKHYLKYRENHSWSKILVVSPDIATAKMYLEFLKYNKNLKCAIATSEDPKGCKDAIKRYKYDNDNLDSLNCLVTVGVAYEGMDIVQATHLTLLTLIRSKQWLTQCLARVTRCYKDKKKGYIFAPKDTRIEQVLKQISSGKILSASNNVVKEIQPEKSNNDKNSDWNGGIKALSSEAHLNNLSINGQEDIIEQKETQSEKETRLRKHINDTIRNILHSEGGGNRNTKQRIFWLRVKQIANKGRCPNTNKLITKKLEEMSVKELQKVSDFCKNYA